MRVDVFLLWKRRRNERNKRVLVVYEQRAIWYYTCKIKVHVRICRPCFCIWFRLSAPFIITVMWERPSCSILLFFYTGSSFADPCFVIFFFFKQIVTSLKKISWNLDGHINLNSSVGDFLECSVGVVPRNTKKAKKARNAKKAAGKLLREMGLAGVFRAGALKAKQVVIIKWFKEKVFAEIFVSMFLQDRNSSSWHNTQHCVFVIRIRHMFPAFAGGGIRVVLLTPGNTRLPYARKL